MLVCFNCGKGLSGVDACYHMTHANFIFGWIAPLTTRPVKAIRGSLWIWHAGLRLTDTSTSPGNALNALPRSSALALCGTEWQQALTASLA